MAIIAHLIHRKIATFTIANPENGQQKCSKFHCFVVFILCINIGRSVLVFVCVSTMDAAADNEKRD